MTPDNAAILCFAGLGTLALLDVFLSRRSRSEMEALSQRIEKTRSIVERELEAYRKALFDIAEQDDVEMALDPQWAKRIAAKALETVEAAP